MKTWQIILCAVIVIVFCGLTFFITKEIYKAPSPKARTDTSYVPYPVPGKPIYIKGRIDTVRADTVFTSITDTIRIPEGTLLASTDTTANFNLEGDSLSIAASYTFPPANFFQIGIKSYYRKRINQVDTVFREQPKSFWNKFHFGIGAGVGYEFKEKKTYPSLFIGGFYEL